MNPLLCLDKFLICLSIIFNLLDFQRLPNAQPRPMTTTISQCNFSDGSALYGGDMKTAAERVKAKMLLVFSLDDHMVTPGEGISFGRLVNARGVEIPGLCGHLIVFCESEKIGLAIRGFLEQ